MAQQNIITLNNVSHSYGQNKPALSHIQLQIPIGSFVLVTGHSGAGKSTLLKIMRGDIVPSVGDVYVHGFPVRNFSNDDRSLLKQSTGFIDQDPAFLGTMTVRENLHFFAEMNQYPKHDSDLLLERVGLSHTIHMYPSELSRGQRQILQSVRAIMHKPFLLIADEPIAHLDDIFTQALVSLFLDLQKSGSTIVVASHKVDVFSDFNAVVKIRLEKGMQIT